MHEWYDMDYLNKIRIYADKETKNILDIDLINLVIGEWVYEEDKKCFDMKIENKHSFRDDNDDNNENNDEILRIGLCVDNCLWDKFKGICNRRDIRVETGFRLAVISFLSKHRRR